MTIIIDTPGSGGGGSGTVTNVATAGIATGGPITTTGTITVTAAVQSDQETATSNAVAVTPGVQQFHPSAAKCWVQWGVTTTIDASYNTTSITDNGTGDWTITIATDFSSANYVAVGTPYAASDFSNFHANWGCNFDTATAKAAGVLRVIVSSLAYTGSAITSGQRDDPTKNHVAMFGDQ